MNNNKKRSREDEIDSSSWAFEVDYNDHFETPKKAYEDLLPFLSAISKHCTAAPKNLNDLIVYDPYYCKGSVIENFSSLGVPRVINRNVDFYKVIKKNNIPEFDVLVTNPPYSGEHKVKLINFLVSKPTISFALLLPAYTVTKSYWQQFVTNSTATIASSSSSQQRSEKHFIYLMPPSSYEFFHPEGTGKSLPPFYSCWFIGLSAAMGHADIQRLIAELKQATSSTTIARPMNSALSSLSSSSSSSSSSSTAVAKSKQHNAVQVLTHWQELVSRGYVSGEKRPNLKSRKRLKRRIDEQAQSRVAIKNG